ncbi:fumarylacetoacetate hydrolase family protein [Billgrantia diversa]|uniref:fumarylacetoacetate hydrolase family protein n=1 Tax=Halomonas sp. MCCC 1A13316 TaxID=2733487 RepID=UPI0018A36A5E|nr:fumarylacetoacetate hydrolase family protein [Halomonas sp. MCCC 1A13316]QOR40434.1 fumarylacetoacetate hydrolase family protein [Halomonas sp. MCCC 1A13316]
MRFVPRFTDGQAFSHPLGKIVCVGRNYADHAKELNNPIPSEPLLFIKPATSAASFDAPIEAPFARGEVHYEAELALLIGERLSHATPGEAERAIVGIGLALDLTLRDLQARLKEKGHPWEVAKAFDGACPLTDFLPLDRVPNWSALSFELEINGELRQHGEGADMLFPVPTLVAEMSRHFTLDPGDVVLTGTPAGVGELQRGATLRLSLTGGLEVSGQVAE